MAQLTGAVSWPQGGTLDRGHATALLAAIAAASSGTGTEFGITPTGVTRQSVDKFALQSFVTGTGSFSAVSVKVEGTLDGTHWSTIATLNVTSGEIQFISLEKLIGIRANVTTLTAASGAPLYNLNVLI